MEKRLIEDLLPLGELNKHAQKGGGIGSLNAMHPYFARRPLTASRAMTLAALVSAPRDDEERDKLEKLLVKLSEEEWPSDSESLEAARALVRAAHGGQAPRVLDPFAGGGSMPLEALRLGCEATALDLNPVAYLALIASLVYPQKYREGSPNGVKPDVVLRDLPAELVDLDTDNNENEEDDSPRPEGEGLGVRAKGQTTLPGIENGHNVSPFVEDVRRWAEYVQIQAEAQIGDCYPKDPDGATPVAYLWAKTITCPHCAGEIPLIRRRWLQTIDGRDPVAYRLNVDRDAQTYTVEILRGVAATDDQPNQGTMRGATVECPYCGTPSERERIVEQGRAGEIGQALLVVALSREGETGRDFRAANERDRAAYALAEQKLAEAEAQGYDFWGFDRLLSVVPDEPTPPERSRATAIRSYGVARWGQMFNARQLLAILTLGQQIRAVKELLSKNESYAEAISLILDLILMKQVAYTSNVAWWQTGGLKIAPTMARHDIQITWDYSETNPFSGYAASWSSCVNAFYRTVDNLAKIDHTASSVRLGSATVLPAEWTDSFDAVITDPPYYDSINYGDLSDFFYVWHKRVVGDDYPEAFISEVTPKDEELIQEQVYHGGTKKAAKQYYEDGMAQAFREMNRVLKKNGIAVIMFAHKKSSAWETLVSALIRAGFQVTASWPLQTEGRRLQSYRAVALASSVYLVCRKRSKTGGLTGYLEDIRAELSQTIRRYLEKFWAAGIGGADFFMSAIGPGLSVYSRFARVERYDGSQVSVGDFLDLVRHEVAVFAIERIVGERGFTERIDQATQFYLLWRWGYGDWDVPDGEAVLLSTAVGIDLKVLMSRFALVGSVKGKLRLLTPVERTDSLERVVDRVEAGGAVPLVDVLHKACLLWTDDQQDALSTLVAARGGEMWPVAQAVVELLPRDHPERRALESMLGIRVDIESRAQKWAETQYKPKPKQMTLWNDSGE
ncbi:MAG: DUF1156 domain-containing protein [Anaerolineae bacterium]|nr:DUF1156 domain-containing protein [Anaerolineae bacterium]